MSEMQFGQELDHDYTAHTRQFAGDDKLFKMFYKGFVPDEERSLEEGRPIFRDVVKIKIITPGNRDNIVDREMQPHDKFRFRDAWERFSKGMSELGDGTPLTEWPMIGASMIEELKFFGFYTVEHVAKAGDAAKMKMPGLRELSTRAVAWLEVTKGAADTAKLLKENESKDARIAALEQQVAELGRLAQSPRNAEPLPSVADSTGGINPNKATK